MNEPVEKRIAELEGFLALDEAGVVASMAAAAKKRRLSIGAAKYLRKDTKRFTFVWHLKKQNLED